jgi:predicted RNA binding protein YcfA (HicA-like mRNA interferase family)
VSRLPRNVSARQLVKVLESLGYQFVRQTGSHIRLTHVESSLSVTVPAHNPIKVGTLAAILSEVTLQTGVDRAALVSMIGV